MKEVLSLDLLLLIVYVRDFQSAGHAPLGVCELPLGGARGRKKCDGGLEWFFKWDFKHFFCEKCQIKN